MFTCMQTSCHLFLHTFTSNLFLFFRVYAFVPSIMKNDQECFLTVVLPFTKSSLPSFLTFGTTVSGFSNEFCRSAMSAHMSQRVRLTTAAKSSEYISCTSTELTSNPSNRRSRSKSAEGCRFRILSRILFLSAVIMATVSMYAGFKSAF
jgi:hypothetical protein